MTAEQHLRGISLISASLAVGIVCPKLLRLGGFWAIVGSILLIVYCYIMLLSTLELKRRMEQFIEPEDEP